MVANTMKVEMRETLRLSNAVQLAGEFLLRYGLVLVLAWIGAMKFTAYEAKGIQGLVATSPLMSWMYGVLSLQGVSNLLGVVEISTALLIALRPLSTRLAIVGSCLAILTFLTTLTFLFSLPGWEQSLGGFPALSGSGGFLLKDAVLLGASVWSLGEALTATHYSTRTPD
jgi:reactive chlorine resistance protein C